MNDKPIRILSFEDDLEYVHLMREVLTRATGASFDLECAERLSTGLERLAEGDIDVVLLNLSLPDSRGSDTFIQVHARAPDVPIIVLTDHDDEELSVEIVRKGAQDYLVKGWTDEYLLVRAMRYAIERKRAQEALRESEERFRLLYERVPLSYQSLDEDGRLVEVNQAWLDTLGYEREEVVGQWFSSFLAPEHVDHFRDYFPRFKAAGETEGVEFEMMRKDGSYIIVSFNGKIGYDEQGNFRQTHCILHNVTERKRVEEALQESEERYRSLFEFSPVPVTLIDLDGTVLDCNSMAAEISGLPREDIVGQPFLESGRLKEEDTARYVELFSRVISGEETGAQELEIIRGDNETHWIEASAVPLIRGGEVCALQVITRDVTERKQAEEALRQERDFAEGMIETAQAIVLVLDTEGRIVRFNPYMEEMSGYQLEEVQGKDWFTTFLPERDHTHIRKLFSRAVGDIQTRGNVNPIVTKSGRERMVEWYDKTLKDSEGNVVGILAIGQDITERKQAEEALRQERDRAQKYLDVAGVMMLVLNEKGEIVLINPRGCQILGYKEKVLNGRNWFDACLPSAIREEVKSIFEQLMAGEIEAVEYYENPVLTRSGEERTIAWHNTVLRDQAGRITGTLSSGEDITERKRAEEALRRSLEETARSQRLLLALSQAAQAVQRAHTPKEVYHTIGDEIARLGYQATIFTLTDDQPHLAVSHLTFEPALLRVAEKLTGLLVQDHRLSLVPGSPYLRIIAEDKAAFHDSAAEFVAQALPRPIRPLASKVAALLGIERSILAPLKVSGETYGLLAVLGADLTEADVPAVTAFANQAAIAIENARLLEQVRLGHARLQALSRQLLQIQEAERRHIARELHDEVGQILTGLNLLLEISARAPAEAIGARSGEARAMVEELMEKVDELSLDLRPAMLDDLGLLAALLWHVERYTAQTGARVHLEHSGLERRFAAEIETAAYRVVQEALTNVARHAGVSEVTVRLWADQDTLSVQVEDQGAGFDPQATLAAGDTSGLSGMRERAALLGGQLTVESAPGVGTRLTAEWPLQEAVS